MKEKSVQNNADSNSISLVTSKRQCDGPDSPSKNSSVDDEIDFWGQPDGLVRLEKINQLGNAEFSFVVRVSFIAGLGGILFGYDLGVISAALPYLSKDFGLTEMEEGLVVSILYVGGFGGAILGGYMCDSIGRKNSILVTDFFFLLGAMMLYLANSYGFVLYGRIVVGFAVAVSGIADVCYLNEVAPTQWRGAVVSVNEACISLGFLLAFITGSLLPHGEDAWRLMFGLSGTLALLQFVGMWTMPESPKWLKERARQSEKPGDLSEVLTEERSRSSDLRHKSLDHRYSPDTVSLGATRRQQVTNESRSNSFIADDDPGSGNSALGSANYRAFGSNDPKATFSAEETVEHDSLPMRCHNLGQNVESSFFAVLTSYPRQAWITLFLSIIQQLCGQTCVLSFAPQIFASISGNASSASSFVRGWTTVSIGIVKFAVTIFVILYIESFGRRPLLLSGIISIAGGLCFLVTSQILHNSVINSESGDVGEYGDSNIIKETNDVFGLYVAIAGVMLVVCGYSMSFGPLTWLLTSEIFPTEIRGRALGASTILNFGSAIFATSTFLSIRSAIGSAAIFGCYFIITLCGFCFAMAAIPETKEKTVEQIDMDLGGMFWWNRIHVYNEKGLSSSLFGIKDKGKDKN